MSTPNELIESGLIEAYLLGSASPEEAEEVESMAAAFPQVRDEMEHIEIALANYAMEHAIAPAAEVKAYVMATIDYTSRMKNGEKFEDAPLLSENSKITDYSRWLENPDFKPAGGQENLEAKIISYVPEKLTAIVWVAQQTPLETHTDEFESFLIVEGTCDITIGDKMYKLVPGDFLTIPLHKPHQVRVTSDIPCKVILQRVAA